MKIVDIANAEIGYLEKKSNSQLESKTANAGNKNFTKYGEWYGMNGQPWCAMFVSWCADRAGIGTDIIPKHASCAVGIKWFKERGLWADRKGYKPKEGDIIYFQSGANNRHVGIVTKVTDERVYTVEGNTSGGSTMISNGGSVAAKNYALSYSKILGYGKPKYVEDDDMTGKEIFEKLQEYLRTQKVPDWAKDELREAINLGITDGKNPCELVPRYQAAIMAKRTVRK